MEVPISPVGGQKAKDGIFNPPNNGLPEYNPNFMPTIGAETPIESKIINKYNTIYLYFNYFLNLFIFQNCFKFVLIASLLFQFLHSFFKYICLFCL